MYHKVIVPTDGSDCAAEGVEEGLKMAQIMDIPAVAVFVVDESQFEALHYESIKKSAARGFKERGKKTLKELHKKALDMDVKLEKKILVGKPYQKICDEAGEADIIYISSHGSSGFTRLFMGSTTEKVLKHSKSTVAVVKGSHFSLE